MVSKPPSVRASRRTRLIAPLLVAAVALLCFAYASVADTVTLSVGAVTSSSVSLSWGKSGTATVSSYQVGINLGSSTSWRYVGTATTYTASGLASQTTYKFMVKADTSAGTIYSNAVYATPTNQATVPAAPSSLAAVAASSNQIDLTWQDNSSNETGFKVERASSSAGPYAEIGQTTAGDTTYSDTGLVAGSLYYYRICAFNSAGNSAYSNTVYATTPAAPPAAPSGLAATAASSTQINLTWTDNSNNETAFRIERSPSPGGAFALLTTVGANVTTYANTGLAAETTYYYRVCATNSTGQSAYSATAGATTLAGAPAAPSGLTATAVSSSKIKLAWQDNSSNETGFNIERASAAGGPYTKIGSVGAGVKSYSDTGLPPAATRHYRVQSFNAAGGSAYSASASATTHDVAPAAPSGLVAAAVSESQINLAWTDNSSNETGFRVERFVATSGTYVQLGIVASNVTSYSDSGLDAGKSYCYRVCAVGTAGASAYAGPACGTLPEPLPQPPTNLAAAVVSSTRIDLSWTDNSSNETGFRIERGSAAAGPFAQIALVQAGVNSYADSSLIPATTYYYRVCAYGAAGDSAFAGPVNATTSDTVPAAPSSLGAAAASSTQINLTWVDNSTNESGFKIQRSASSGGPYTQIATVGAGVTSYSNTGLSPATTYYYRVCAYNWAGDSAYAGPVSATTPAQPPSAPTGLTATAVSASQINLAWTDNSSNESGFKILRSTLADGPFSQIATVGVGVTSYANTGLAESVTYYYRVCAYNSAGDSGYAGPASATTLGTVPAAPTNLSATAASSSQINLSWTDNSTNEAGFKVERSTASGGPYTEIATVASGITSYSNGGLSAKTTYYYRVRAYNAAGNSAYAGPASATTAGTPPAAPTNLAASAVSSTQINLAWTDNSSDESGFRVERASVSSGPYTEIATLAPGVTSYANTGLASGYTYYYRVCAYNASGNSAYAGPVGASTQAQAPAAPTNLTAAPSGVGMIALNWTDNSNNESGFKIERSSSSGGPYSALTTVGSGVTTYTDFGLSAATTYYYRVYAYNSSGNSAYAGPVSATTQDNPPTAPNNLTVTVQSTTELDLQWADNSSNETGFKVERSFSSGGPFIQIGTTAAGAVFYKDTGLVGDTTYYYRVCAYNAYGNSAYTATASALPLKAPTNLTAAPVSSTQVNLTWTDNSAKEANYTVERSTDGANWSLLATLPANTTSYADTLCQPQTSYYYRVRALGSLSDYSNTASVTTPLTAPTLKLSGMMPDVGSVSDVIASSGIAYLASDPFGLVVVDVSDPNAPFVVGSQYPAGPANQVAVTGTIAVATGTPRGTDIIDISDPTRPVVASSVAGSSGDVAINGRYAYVAAQGDLQVVDLAVPWNAVVVGTVVTPSIAYGVAVSGTKAVVSDAFAGLHVLDISNPASPRIAGSVSLGGFAGKVAIAGNTALVANSNLGGVQIVDISNAASPRLLTTVSTGSAPNVTVSGSIAYVSANGNGLYIIDISNPASPVVLATYGAPASACAVSDGIAYLAQGSLGVHLVDVSNPAAPRGLFTLTNKSASNQVAVTGTIAVATGTPRGTDIIDISDPTRPVVASSVAGSSGDVAINGRYAYVAAQGDLQVVDLAVPWNAVVVGTVVTPSIAYGVAVSGTKAVVSDAFAGLHVLDISNPASPRIAGSVSLGGFAGKVAIAGNTALVANSNLGGVQIVDISNAASPRLLTTVSTGSAPNVTVSGSIAYVSANGNGLYIIDISNPASPVVLATYGAPASACAVSDGIAYLAQGSLGVHLVDVSNPAAPRGVATYKTVGSCSDVTVIPGYVIAADGTSLLSIFEMLY